MYMSGCDTGLTFRVCFAGSHVPVGAGLNICQQKTINYSRGLRCSQLGKKCLEPNANENRFGAKNRLIQVLLLPTCGGYLYLDTRLKATLVLIVSYSI